MMFNGIAIHHSLSGAANSGFSHAGLSARDLGSFVQTGEFRLDLLTSKVLFDDDALELHSIAGRGHELGIGEWVSLYHAEDRLSILKLIKQATTLMRGFRFQARTAGDTDLVPTIECYARCEDGVFHGIFLSSRMCYAFIE